MKKLQNEHDIVLAELQTRTASLAQRNNEYGERTEHQTTTIDVDGNVAFAMRPPASL